MDEDGQSNTTSTQRNEPSSTESTRRNSNSSVANTSSGAQYASITAPSETIRRRPQPQQAYTTGYGTIGSSATARAQITSPDTTKPYKYPKKPGIGRRTTSAHAPHKGQEFSVDDAQDEVNIELGQQNKERQTKSTAGSLRRRPSNIRRRSIQPNLTSTTGNPTDTDDGTRGRSVAATEEQPFSVPPDEVSSPDAEDSVAGVDDENDDEEGDVSDAESFTLKDRQEAINETHPFGIRIWKPALYKKSRSVQRNAEGDIHSTPGLYVSRWLLLFNFAWSALFGWWLALLSALGALICLLLGFSDGCMEYGMVFWGLAGYLLFPFGKYVKLVSEEAYVEEDEGEGRSISEYEQWQSGDIEEGRMFFGPVNVHRSLIGRRRNSIDSSSETDSLLGRSGRAGLEEDAEPVRPKRRLFGRGKWNIGRVIFFVVFYGILAPLLFLVSGLCWLMVFSIPMGKVTLLLVSHLRRHPLALSFHSNSADIRRPGEPPSSILLCTYRAVGAKYWKYTIDGTNIFLINLLGIVAFVIFDYWILDYTLGLKIPLTSQGLIFTLALFSIIPLAYFIGQAVASISAQSSMGVGATINAFFSTIVEVFLYCVALQEGKAQLVEGSIIGSIFAGILFLPGLSMCFGALKRKTQRFNVKSAGVTSTMLLFAVIGVFGPTLFYQIYGSHKLNCHRCIIHHDHENKGPDRDCRRCYFAQAPAVHDRFYIEAVRPFIWFCSVMLFLSYVIGLLFTLRTHAAVIWNNDFDEKKTDRMDVNASYHSASGQQESQYSLSRQLSRDVTTIPRSEIRESQLYKRILGQSFRQVGLGPNGELPPSPHEEREQQSSRVESPTVHLVPPNSSSTPPRLEGFSDEQSQALVHTVAEMAATAAVVAARDVTKAPRKPTQAPSTPQRGMSERPNLARGATFEEAEDANQSHATGGHDAPNWSKTKSAVILLTATIAYAVIAEILVNTVDAVLEHVDIDEKFLGITLFALVPNTTEFLNAISFAMNGNIALSMEIGSAYALQVCLLQIPALVLYSAFHGHFIDQSDMIDHTFTLIFPQWDMVCVILCVFLLSYMYGEGKSNYFKGSILILSYLVVIVGFYFSGFNSMDVKGIDQYDTLALGGLVEHKVQSMEFTTNGRALGGKAV